jgi:hypothetical protein
MKTQTKRRPSPGRMERRMRQPAKEILAQSPKSVNEGENCTCTVFRSAKNRSLADSLVTEIEDLRDYWPLTVRQAYYQMVARLVVSNNQSQYKRVSRVLVTLRENDLIP